MISSLVRRGYQAEEVLQKRKARTRNGVEMFPRRGEPVTLAHVQKLQDLAL